MLLASYLIPAKLHLLDETIVGKIEESFRDELPRTANFEQEVRKLTP